MLQYFGTSTLAGMILAFMGPFGTAQYDLYYRFFYWIGLCLAGGLGTAMVDMIISRFRKPISAPLMAFIQSIGATLFVATFFFVFSSFAFSLEGVLVSLFYIWLVAIVICSVGMLARTRKEDGKPKPERPALFERLPPKLRRAEIYAISSEDHYVRVFTSAGEEMILMRLSDAIKETAPLKGLSPHRSWWVAEDGIDTVKRKDSKVIITIRNGSDVPVSRGKVKEVKEAGWLS